MTLKKLIGMGKDFLGCYDLFNDQLILMNKTGDKSQINAIIETCQGLDDPKLDQLLPAQAVAKLREDVEMVKELCPPFSLESYLAGVQTPVFFGSAINNFGVREVLEGLHQIAPTPRPQPTAERTISPDENKVTGFIFKIQANMDPKHRDRIAFMRISSGHFKRGMTLTQVRTGKGLKVPTPVMFLIPSFAPELLKSVRALDPLKSKHLGAALQQIAEEGGASVFKPIVGSEWIVGVVGTLQFEVMADRIKNEFNIPVVFEPTQYYTARWVECPNKAMFEKFRNATQLNLAEDHDGELVFLARNAWHLGKVQEDFPDLVLKKTREQVI